MNIRQLLLWPFRTLWGYYETYHGHGRPLRTDKNDGGVISTH